MRESMSTLAFRPPAHGGTVTVHYPPRVSRTRNAIRDEGLAVCARSERSLGERVDPIGEQPRPEGRPRGGLTSGGIW